MGALRILLFAAATLSLGLWFPWNWSRPAAKKEKVATPVVSFDQRVKPILAARCQPCHFPGGSMHAQLPFDQPQTIRQLGTALFTRIRDEKQREVIRAFLAQER